jgi:glycosyltransferase involved in cell wall biosynthesis
MPRFAGWLVKGMEERGHQIEIWCPESKTSGMTRHPSLKKWMGYFDQYVLFPLEIGRKIKTHPKDTLYVFTDHALGPWVPLVADRPHVVHCHDFLAQRSARGEIKENPTGWTGRQYQALIHRGYSRGKNFISVSNKTREDLKRFMVTPTWRSEMVYNGLNQSFFPQDPELSRTLLGERIEANLTDGFLLHVGGNEWYKNRLGVIAIYNSWRSGGGRKLPLLLVGHPPNASIINSYQQSQFNSEIYFISGLEDEFLRLAYSGASLLLFPSLAEGFGWPIAEAMASGCPVITTDEAPMTEVAGTAGFFIPRCPDGPDDAFKWANNAAQVVDQVVQLSSVERIDVIEAGLNNANRFDPIIALDQIQRIYQEVLSNKDSVKTRIKKVI